jgi:hypothetical protein
MAATVAAAVPSGEGGSGTGWIGSGGPVAHHPAAGPGRTLQAVARKRVKEAAKQKVSSKRHAKKLLSGTQP